MALHGHFLRKQVCAELRRRRLIFLTVMLLTIMSVIITMIFGNMGYMRYRELRKTEARLVKEIRDIEQDNARLRAQLKSLKEDSFLKEKHAREDYGLAKPDEYVFQYDR